MSKSGPYHEQLREALQRTQAARLAVASLEPGASQDAALTKLRDAEAELQRARDPFKLAADHFPDPADGS